MYSYRRLAVPSAACGLALLLVAPAMAAEKASPGRSLFAKPAVKVEVQQNAAATVAKQEPAADPSASAARPSKPAEADNRVMRLEVTVPAGGDLAAAYDEYFQKNVVHPKVVRAKVRRLVGKAKTPEQHEEVIALLEAAIRNGQSQSWMFEGLALSMEMAGRPAADIERVLMSAADFTTNPTNVMYLAHFFARLGHDARALQLFRQAAIVAPQRTEPLEHGLGLALRLDDLDALKWASLGILRQAWPQEKKSLEQRARYAAEAVLEKLRSQGRDEEVKQFAAAMDQAMRRDLTIRIRWEGDADVDLTIQEPNGTLCSLRNRRTTGGGVLIGESNAKTSWETGSTESYVCPEAFSGNYRVLLKLVWGRIPAGKVTLEVTTLDANGKPLRSVQQVAVNEKDALGTLQVAHGRRESSLELEQVATDIRQQLAVNRTILAQQIAALAEPETIRAQQIASQAQVPFVISTTPVLGRNGVGYRPEITLLPSGATLSATAVISADRRYVRITALPFFSQIGDVATFEVDQQTTILF